VNKVQGSLI